MTTLIHICFAGITLAMGLSFFRLVKGPSVTDRMLAFEMIAMAAVGVMVLVSCSWDTSLHLEVIMIFALLGFLSTLAFAFYLSKSDAESVGTPREDSSQPEPPKGNS